MSKETQTKGGKEGDVVVESHYPLSPLPFPILLSYSEPKRPSFFVRLIVLWYSAFVFGNRVAKSNISLSSWYVLTSHTHHYARHSAIEEQSASCPEFVTPA